MLMKFQNGISIETAQEGKETSYLIRGKIRGKRKAAVLGTAAKLL